MLEIEMLSVDTAGSITSVAHLVEVMAANPVGTVFLIILVALVVFGIWAWKNPGQALRPAGRRRR